MKIFISQPMRFKSNKQIAQEFERAAVINARKWAEAGAYAKIALECVEER